MTSHWTVTPCGLVGWAEGGQRTFLQNVGIDPVVHTSSQPRTKSTSSPQREPQIPHSTQYFQVPLFIIRLTVSRYLHESHKAASDWMRQAYRGSNIQQVLQFISSEGIKFTTNNTLSSPLARALH
jgi:hypothetical protein